MSDKDKPGPDDLPENVIKATFRRQMGRGVKKEDDKRRTSQNKAQIFMSDMREKVELSSDAEKQRPLTVEETVFVSALSEGDSLGQAYMRAYPLEEVTKGEAYARGRMMSTKPNVANAIVELVDANRLWDGHTGKRLRLFIARQLEDIAASSPNDSARIAALRELGKLDHVRAYEEQKEEDQATASPSEIMRQIEERLKKAKG